jgi:hypothetical protein
MKKWFLIAAFTISVQAINAQQHFLDRGEIAPCNYIGMPNIRMVTNTVTVLLPEETAINSHVCGKVVSVFQVSNESLVLVKTTEDLYVGFAHLKKAYVKNGDEVQLKTPIGMPLPGNAAGTWSLFISYDTSEKEVPCEKAIEMIRLTQPKSIVMQNNLKK